MLNTSPLNLSFADAEKFGSEGPAPGMLGSGIIARSFNAGCERRSLGITLPENGFLSAGVAPPNGLKIS